MIDHDIFKLIESNKEYDMGLLHHPFDEHLLNNFQTHWIKEENNLAILTSFSVQPPDIAKIIQLFSLNIWYQILMTTLLITFFNTIYNFVIGDYLCDSLLTKLKNIIYFLSKIIQRKFH
jgi:hypothetical protein